MKLLLLLCLIFLYINNVKSVSPLLKKYRFSEEKGPKIKIWGKFCGPNYPSNIFANLRTKPIDELDQCCKTHDLHFSAVNPDDKENNYWDCIGNKELVKCIDKNVFGKKGTSIGAKMVAGMVRNFFDTIPCKCNNFVGTSATRVRNKFCWSHRRCHPHAVKSKKDESEPIEKFPSDEWCCVSTKVKGVIKFITAISENEDASSRDVKIGGAAAGAASAAAQVKAVTKGKKIQAKGGASVGATKKGKEVIKDVLKKCSPDACKKAEARAKSNAK